MPGIIRYRDVLTTLLVLAVLLSPHLCQAHGPAAYVVNTLGQTLSKIDLTSGVVDNDIVSLGSDVGAAPNQIVVRDTMAYVVNSTTAEIQIINLNTESTVGYVHLPPGSNPFHMAFYDDRFAYVTLLVANEIAKVDVQMRSIVFRKPIGLAPGPIVIANYKAYVGITALDENYEFQQGKLAVFDCRADSLLPSINVRTNPNAMAVDSEHRLHILCSGDFVSEFCWVEVFDSRTDSLIDSLYLGGSPSALTIGPDDMAYVAAGGWVTNGEMYQYNASTMAVMHDAENPASVPRGCIAVAAFQDSTVFSLGFNDTVGVANAGATLVERYAVGDGPVWVDFNYRPGDIDGDWQVSLSDLTRLIDLLFISLEAPPVAWRANINGDFSIDLGDLSALIRYLFITPGQNPPKMGPIWLG